jgi:4-hydroxybenzoyl-CoA reductase subunit alpha
VQLKLDRSGRATVFCGASEIGQGVDSVLAYIVCEELGLMLGDVRVVAADTDLTPVDLGSYSSRETFMVGNACLDAARALRGKIVEALAHAWGVRARRGDARRRRRVRHARAHERHAMTVKEAFPARGIAVRYARLGGLVPEPAARRRLPRRAHRRLARVLFTAHGRRGGVRSRDRASVGVMKLWVAHDCGRALNRSRSRARWRAARTWATPRR